MKKYVILFMMGVFLFAMHVRAWECEYGTVNAWVKLSNDTQWREAMVDDVTLKVHEPFKVKVQITTKMKCHVSFELYDPGVTKVFEVVNGASKNGEDVDENNCPANWTKTYEWTVRPTGKWTEGWAPLNFFIQFTDPNTGYNEKIDKTIIHAYISPEEWEGEGNEENNNGGHVPAFEIWGIAAALAMVICLRKRR